MLYKKCLLDAAKNFWSKAAGKVIIGLKKDLTYIQDTVEKNCPDMPTDQQSLFGDLDIMDTTEL